MKTTPKHFCVISLTDAPNGAEQVLLKMVIEVKADFIFLRKNSGPQLVIPQHIATRFLSQSAILFGLIKLIPIVRKVGEQDVIMSTHPYLNAYLGFFKRIGWLKAKLVARECTSVFTRFSSIKRLVYQSLYKIGYPAIDIVICQTELMKDQLTRWNSFIDKRKILVLPNPVDLKQIVEQGSQCLKVDGNFICAAGRLIPEKGFDILIEAFSVVHQKYPDYKLIILGEGGERNTLTKLVNQLKLKEVVLFKGHVNNPAPYFKQAKLCVVSSIKEGFPNTLLEMMALNKKVVSTLCAGGISSIPYIIKVPTNDFRSLAIAMQSQLQNEDQYGYEVCVAYLKQRNPEKFAQSILGALA